MTNESKPPLHNYSEADRQTITGEMQDLSRLWNSYIDMLNNSSVDLGVHPPPALSWLLAELLENTDALHIIRARLNVTTNQADPDTEIFTNLGYSMMSLGATMFKFGQFASNNGMLEANMLPCNCGTVTDDELTKFIGEPGA